MEAKFHHIGYATKSISKSQQVFESLGYQTEGGLVVDKRLGVVIQFLVNPENQNARLELVQDFVEGDNHPIPEIVKQRPGSYHLAYSVESIQKFSLANLLRAITPCMPAAAFEGRHVRFFMSRDEGILELISNAVVCDCSNAK